jgi:hypothetical protein
VAGRCAVDVGSGNDNAMIGVCMSEKREALIEETYELLNDVTSECSPLLLSGDGSFYHKNGVLVRDHEVLRSHHKLGEVISRALSYLHAIKDME